MSSQKQSWIRFHRASKEMISWSKSLGCLMRKSRQSAKSWSWPVDLHIMRELLQNMWWKEWLGFRWKQIWLLSSDTVIRSWGTEHWLWSSASQERLQILWRHCVKQSREGQRYLELSMLSEVLSQERQIMSCIHGRDRRLRLRQQKHTPVSWSHCICWPWNLHLWEGKSQIRKCGDILKIFRNFRSRWSCY